MIKNIIMKILYKNTYSSDAYVNYLKRIGCDIGSGTTFFSPNHVTIDTTRPWLIKIGKNVQITRDVSILTHGYDWSVLKGYNNEILGSSGKVTIGDNVFIGVKSTILKGVTIGNNVIIGANSLVNKDIPDNVIAAGNPAKVIMTLDEYYNKRKKQQLSEAVELTIEYYKKYRKWPDRKVLREFIWLFEERNNAIENNEVFSEIGSLIGNYEQTKNAFLNGKGQFENYEAFIEYCKKQTKD